MSRNAIKNNKNIKDCRKSFLILPGIFLLCGYLLIYVAFLPVARPFLSMYSLAFTGNTSSLGTNADDISSIFSGNTGRTGGDIKASEIEYPTWGDHFGTILVEGTKINAPLIFGDSVTLLNKGACVSLYGGVPGYAKTVMVSAHNNTFFRDLQSSGNIGALVNIETNYGSYVYRIVEKKIAHRDDTSAYISYIEREDDKENEFLIIYTCQKENGISISKYRCYAFCEYVSGPMIDKYN
ncbi:MAG: sortase [Clostridiales bacterium]|jgi:sortase A|nr:sortase [Clostridiales bacterium]